MKKNTTFLAILFLLLSACSAEIVEPQQNTESNAVRSNFVPMEVARKKMLQILSSLNGQIKDDVNKIGTGDATDIVSAIALDKDKQPVTRGAEESDADCYVFRMENNMFAIMSATTDRPELIPFTL